MHEARSGSVFLWALLGVLLLWVAQPVWKPWVSHSAPIPAASKQPLAVTARGDLAADELSTISIFEHNSPSVVYITTIDRVRDF